MSPPFASRSAVPVTVLTGFLGAGKTTLLNRILTADHGLRVAVLVNDFGAINVDAELVVGVEDDMISLANGCVCCQVRDDLIEAIDAVLARPETVDYILLEASGVADPAGIFATFTDAKYSDRIRIDSITCVVDAEQIFDENEPQPVALLKLRQIGFADMLIVNKTDLVTPEHLAALRSWIDSHLNRVRVVEASHCNVPLDVLLGAGRFDAFRETQGEHAAPQADAVQSHDHGHDFSSWSYESAEPFSLGSLREMIKRRLPRGVYRCKGTFYCEELPQQRCVLQVVGRRCDVTVDRPWNGKTPLTRIVAIGAAGALDPDELKGLFDRCVAGRQPEPGPAEKSSGVRVVRI